MTPPASRGTNELVATANALAPGQAGRRALTREAVFGVALRIIDHHGLGALTIRRLAEDLGVGLPTLYSVAGGKKEILAGVVDLVFAEVPEHSPDDEQWEESLFHLLVALHEQLIAHPAVAQLAVISRPFGAATARTQESVLDLLKAGRIDESQLVVAYTTLTSYVTGFTLLRISQAASERARGEGLVDQALLRQFPLETFPQLHALAPQLTNAELEARFGEGLRKLIRNLAE